MTTWWSVAAAALGLLSAWDSSGGRPGTPGEKWGRVFWPAVVCLVWGAAAFLAVRMFWPEAIGSPLLRAGLGGALVVLGAAVLLRRMAGRLPSHSHDAPAQARAASSAPLRHSHAGADARPAGSFARNLLPSPAAIAVVLIAAALGERQDGRLPLLVYSTVLVAAGLAASAAHRRTPPAPRVWTLMLSPLLMMALGGALAWTGLSEVHGLAAGPFEGSWGTVLAVSGLGLVLGMRHSTDADHVVAISTIVSKQRGILNAALIGSMWGLGHTITIFAVGALIILAGVTIPPRIGLAMEFSVALMLILLGCLNLTGVTARLMRRLSPASDAATLHDRAPDLPGAQGWVDRLGVFQLVRPLAIGLVHGLAGSAAVALMVLSTIHNPVWATMYLLIFGFGTVLGMMVMTSALAVPLTYAGSRATRLSRYFGITSGLISVCFGLFLVYQLGYVGGLFTSHPKWTPQ